MRRDLVLSLGRQVLERELCSAELCLSCLRCGGRVGARPGDEAAPVLRAPVGVEVVDGGEEAAVHAVERVVHVHLHGTQEHVSESQRRLCVSCSCLRAFC